MIWRADWQPIKIHQQTKPKQGFYLNSIIWEEPSNNMRGKYRDWEEATNMMILKYNIY